MGTESLKLNLIQQIMDLQDIDRLKKIDAILKKVTEDTDILSQLNKPMRPKLDLEAIKREQKFQPIDKTTFFEEMDSLEIEESIEELLEMI